MNRLVTSVIAPHEVTELKKQRKRDKLKQRIIVNPTNRAHNKSNCASSSSQADLRVTSGAHVKVHRYCGSLELSYKTSSMI
jgi:hypothetical protein